MPENRYRVHKTVTLDPMIANKIEELCKAKKMNFSEVLEMCASLGMGRFEQMIGKKEEVKDEVKQEATATPNKDRGQQLADAYMRSVMTGSKGWEA